MPVVTQQQAFRPILLTSPVLRVSEEQKRRVRVVLEVGASDDQFADKMYRAVEFILTSGSVVPPIITSLVPASATLGSPSFTLAVNGTGFVAGSQIIWNGSPEPTTFVSSTTITTGVNMATAQVAIPIPVRVLNPDSVLSDAMTFTLLP